MSICPDLSANVIPLWTKNTSMSMLSAPFHSHLTAKAQHRSVWTATVQVAAELLLCLQFSTQVDSRKDAEYFETINIIKRFWIRFYPVQPSAESNCLPPTMQLANLLLQHYNQTSSLQQCSAKQDLLGNQQILQSQASCRWSAPKSGSHP